MSIVKEYYQHRHDEMLAYIPSDATRTLEIGCGAGIFSAQIKDSLGAETWGVEYQPEVAALAAQKLHRVLTGSIEDTMPELPEHYFDCIIFNDVLEHLVDPYSVFVQVQSLLNKTGVVVASIPNIRHWPEFVDYTLRGNWNYVDKGVLDRTHVRFFTKKSIIATVAQCGYALISIQGINPHYSRMQKIASLLSMGTLADTLYQQYAIVAQPMNNITP
ncbi:SAM-dependent methyltransferase [Sulfuriferula plumbiphila]|uniref:SAM-dependent methyltransferase n=1 Tax=Sulfuriferula plumbiphila TaxID=171865 RepID=A0A512L726_9PROT|nr:class I SAM-dependent methyltransferase [Sulfuriferula plumbiphila]BBP02843.1 SAM-dependent methyltransferase [Sulfuriferula plumbiphila]GEP30290.1 SAM-dependent methyltransferase [Sulfuriferula plumbiphila]